MASHQTTPLEIDGSAMTATVEDAEALLQAGGRTTASSVSTPFFALAVGLLAVNLTSAQPLIGVIAPAIHLAPGAYGLISMLILLGYAAGLILLVPLTDLFENRRLILGMFAGNVTALALAALAQQSWLFLVAMFATGMTTSVIQMLVPLAASLTEPARRGRVVGNIMGGVMLGILLSRPMATVVAEHFGWRVVFGGTAALIAALTASLFQKLPQHRPPSAPHYLDLVASLVAALSRAGARHHDLNAKNVLIADQAMVLDVDRVQFGWKPQDALAHNLARLDRSLRKRRERLGERISDEEIALMARSAAERM